MINLSALGVLAASGLVIYRSARTENRELVRAQAEALVRLGRANIASGRYRSLVEDLGEDFQRFRGVIASPTEEFRFGAQRSPEDCHQIDVRPNAGTDRVLLTLCRHFRSPAAPFGILFVLFFCGSAISLWRLVSLESDVVRKLIDFFAQLGVHPKVDPGIAGIVKAVEDIKGELSLSRQQEVARAQEATLVQVASQVAHDIRAPLAALKVLERDLDDRPAETRLMVHGAISRIQEIANNLLAQRRPKGLLEIGRELALVPVAEALLREKRAQYRDREGLEFRLQADSGAEGVEAQFDPAALARVLSNLIDNSVEAIAGAGHVLVRIAPDSGGVLISIEDTGKGIAADILPRLMRQGETHGKPNGTGLGLYGAKNTIEAWGGRIEITSSLGVGTKVTLHLNSRAAI